MSVLTDIWRQMVQRRLWPVAVLLIAALVAVPLLLAKDPEPTVEAAAPAPANAAPEAVELADSIVTATTTSSRSPGRDVLGKERDIFKSTAKQPKAEKSQDTEPSAPGDAEQPADTGGSSDGGSGGGTADPQPAPGPAPTTPAEPAPKPKVYPQHSLKVRFSGTEGGAKGYLPPDTALPSTANPLLVYVGLLEDEKTAVFLVDSTIQAVGDGECHPTPESCETVRMQEGDTMFFDVVDPGTGESGEQYQLDLLDIYKKKGARSSKARRTAAFASAASTAGPATAALGQVGPSLLSLGRTG